VKTREWMKMRKERAGLIGFEAAAQIIQ